MEALREVAAGEEGRSHAGAAGRHASGIRGALVLTGFMGAGKSSAARALAARLGVRPLDTDRELEAELGESIESFFDREGEAAFRAREEQLVVRMLGDPGTAVLALGGGALASERVREALRVHTVVHLEVDRAEAWRRSSGGGRPLARDERRFAELHAERLPLYEAAASATLPAGDPELPERALPSLLALGEAPPGARLVWATAASGDYPVIVGRGLLATGFFHPPAGRRFAITDERVATHHAIAAERTIAIPPGEREKTLGRAEQVLRELARAGATRDDLVAAVGGGVVGDLAGFCAAVYQRGVPCVQVPTTVVAQVDSAYGGKTGVDLPEGKNYAGAYHQPAAVLTDPATLDTLPPQELRAGFAEVVKTALIAGGELWERVRGGSTTGDSAGGAPPGATDQPGPLPPDAEDILRCLRSKLRVVAEDERDAGRRQVLNLGHTVGHAIEAATGYARYRHGEAVAIGLVCALRLSGRDDLRTEVAELLSARGLPIRYEGARADEVLACLERDKKRSGGAVPFVLVEAPGAVTHGHEVPARELRAALEESAA